MKDDTLLAMVPTECGVAYLSAEQIAEYGGPEAAKQALGVQYLATPGLFFERAELDLLYLGHA